MSAAPQREPGAPLDPAQEKGALAWMAGNSVAANLLMALLLVGGILLAPMIKQEVFPEVTLDTVVITVPYPGASPEDVEQGIVLAVEDAVRGIDGVKEVRSTASEGAATVQVELLLGTDLDEALNEVQRAVDRVTSLPADAERPIISLASNRQEVLSLIVAADTEEKTLRAIGERMRDELLQHDAITLVEMGGVRPLEISVEVPQASLRRYGLTLQQVANAITAASVDMPAGGVRTEGGEILLRVDERRDLGREFELIEVISRPDGTRVTIGDLGVVVDAFKETDQAAYFNGKRAVQVKVFRVGEQGPIEVSDAVQGYLEEARGWLPADAEIAIWNDRSEIYRDRMNLLMRNAYTGLALVLLILGLFLELRMAFWVSLGIPISFLGAMLFMPTMDVSINMISLFAFILTLGIVVDDAIVVGEAVYKHRSDGKSGLRAAIDGAREVAGPVVFSVLTTVMAFMPMLILPGTMGKFFKVIPLIVVPILLISLVESLYILPAHLAHVSTKRPPSVLGWIHSAQQWFSRGFERFIEKVYGPTARLAVRLRYVTLAVCVAMLVVCVAYVRSGGVKVVFFPEIEGDLITASVRMPFGAPVEHTEAVARRLAGSARQVLDESGGFAQLARGLYTEVGSSAGRSMNGPTSATGSHMAQVQLFLVGAGERQGLMTSELTRRWRETMGEVAGVETMTFQYQIGPQSGAAINLELSHPDPAILEQAAASLAEQMAAFAGVTDVDSGVSEGKEQLNLRLTERASALGINQAELARQVRGAFFGAEAARQQRGREELRVYVRRPEAERVSEYELSQMLIRTPQGGEIPLALAAALERGRSYTSISRRDGRRVLQVTADVDAQVANTNEVVAAIKANVLPGLMEGYPGLRWREAGQQQQQSESFGALGTGFMLALFAMYALLAVALRSYFQPIVIMVAIPFSIVGAIVGHIVMGYSLSLMSMMGIVALAGVAINDSLVLVDALNTYRAEGMSAFEAAVAAGERRFRPVLLTSLTTFFGLAPMISETSVQARFLIPMALSLGFGVLFVTFVTLLLVPSLATILDDIARLWAKLKALLFGATSPSPSMGGAGMAPVAASPGGGGGPAQPALAGAAQPALAGAAPTDGAAWPTTTRAPGPTNGGAQKPASDVHESVTTSGVHESVTASGVHEPVPPSTQSREL